MDTLINDEDYDNMSYASDNEFFEHVLGGLEKIDSLSMISDTTSSSDSIGYSSSDEYSSSDTDNSSISSILDENYQSEFITTGGNPLFDSDSDDSFENDITPYIIDGGDENDHYNSDHSDEFDSYNDNIKNNGNSINLETLAMADAATSNISDSKYITVDTNEEDDEENNINNTVNNTSYLVDTTALTVDDSLIGTDSLGMESLGVEDMGISGGYESEPEESKDLDEEENNNVNISIVDSIESIIGGSAENDVSDDEVDISPYVSDEINNDLSDVIKIL